MKRNYAKLSLKILLASVPFVTSCAFLIPGMGVDSMRFINSVKKELNTIIPKGKYVLNPDTPLYEYVVNKTINQSYVIDVLSSSDWSDQDQAGNENNRTKYVNYANDWFHARWDADVKAKKPIDLNDVSMDLISFDKSVAKKFYNPAYVETGFAWTFSKGGMSSFFSAKALNDVYEDASNKEEVINQSDYERFIQYQNNVIDGGNITYSIGNHLSNTKAWFLNSNKQAVQNAISLNALVDPNITADDADWDIKASDFWTPNYTACIYVWYTGTLLLFISPIWALGWTGYWLYKRKGKK